MSRPVAKFTFFALLAAFILWVIKMARSADVWDEEKWNNMGK